LRLGLLAFYLALRLAETQSNFIGSWQHWVWYATPAAWLFKVYYLQYLFIVLPGTIAGELIVRAFQGRSKKDAGFDESPPPPLTRAGLLRSSVFPSSPAFSHARRGEKEPRQRVKTKKINLFWNPLPLGEGRVREKLTALPLTRGVKVRSDFGGMTALKAFLCFAFIPINLVGLFTRSLMLNLALNLAFIGLCSVLFFRNQAVNELQQLHRRLFNNGVFWLLLGLAFEAFEGGIKKDKSTLSYYFLTSGLAFLFLITLSVVVDELRQQRWLQAIIDCGQNPMIAYVTGGMLLIPLLTLTGLQPWYETAFAGAWLGVWLGALRGVLFTALVVVITQFCTKWGVVWRT
jgi:hypothetical protein